MFSEWNGMNSVNIKHKATSQLILSDNTTVYSEHQEAPMMARNQHRLYVVALLGFGVKENDSPYLDVTINKIPLGLC